MKGLHKVKTAGKLTGGLCLAEGEGTFLLQSSTPFG